MKKTYTILSGVVIAFLTTGLQAYASSLTFTETISGIDYEVEGQTYNGQFTDANLKDGSLVFNNTQETITSATVDLTILNDTSLPISLTIDGVTQNLTPSASPQTLAYALTATEYNYIQSKDGTFGYAVVVDCELESAELIVNTTSSQAAVPDGGSTLLLLGGVVSALGLVKRKIA
jgi:hypothetical protein